MWFVTDIAIFLTDIISYMTRIKTFKVKVWEGAYHSLFSDHANDPFALLHSNIRLLTDSNMTGVELVNLLL